MLRIHTGLAILLGVCLMIAHPAQAQWTENFDSYAVGDISGLGPWVDWGGDQLPLVTAEQSASNPNSLKFTLDNANYGTDVYVTTIDPSGVLTSGKWVLSYQLYIDSNYGGQVPMYISQLAMDGTGASFANGTWLRGEENGTLTLLERGTINSPVSLVYDQWTEVKLEIDLDADTVDISYDDYIFYSDRWDYDDTGTPSLGGFNFWASASGAQSGAWYIDDMVLADAEEPPPAQTGDFNGDGKVEAGDLALLLDNWGETNQPLPWTTNWDGFVDADELAALLDNWGVGLGAVPLLDMAAIQTVVPEPATMTLLVLGGLAIARRRGS